MKISELNQFEEETISHLRRRIADGDNEAAKILLEHLRNVSQAISERRKEKDLRAK
jgi:hypothetical protein